MYIEELVTKRLYLLAKGNWIQKKIFDVLSASEASYSIPQECPWGFFRLEEIKLNDYYDTNFPHLRNNERKTMY